MTPATIEELQARFGAGSAGRVLRGEGGLPAIQVDGEQASATIYLLGAQVTSWRPAGADEVLFLSKASRYEEGKAIRGGIPVCFPWFRAKGDSPQAPSHGVVRTKAWELLRIEPRGGVVEVALRTESDEQTRRWWPHAFALELSIGVGKELALALTATNTGESAMRMEEALHTYHRVADARKVEVRGLEGVRYLDNMDGNREKVQDDGVTFVQQIDNAYLQTAAAVELLDPVLGRRIRTVKGNSETTVVWNPWQEGAAQLSDLGADEWEEFACVEASNILRSAVTLAPGESHTMTATLGVLPAEG